MTDLSSLFGFRVDAKEVTRHLSSDFFDEWYYDALHYLDLLKAHPHIAKTIEDQVNLGLGSKPNQSIDRVLQIMIPMA